MEFLTQETPKITILRDGTNEITFHVQKLNLDDFDAFNGKIIKVKLTEFHKKRTITQNSYMWELINCVAEKVGIGSEDCYRRYIKDYGVRDYIAIPNNSVNRFKSDWESKGLGNFVIDLGEAKIDGCTKLAVFYGSSSYDTKELARVIDGLLEDCRELGIPCLTKEEIMKLRNTNDKEVSQ